MVRTLTHLQEPEVQLLAVMAEQVRDRIGPRLRQTEQMERMTEAELGGPWPDLLPVIRAIIGTLEREGILALADLGDQTIARERGYKPGPPSWKITSYGYLFLDFLATPPDGAPRT
jgi:hypothetical protein